MNRVVSSGTPWVATQQPFEGHHSSLGTPYRSMAHHRVVRTTRLETARRSEYGRHHQLVHSNQYPGGHHAWLSIAHERCNLSKKPFKGLKHVLIATVSRLSLANDMNIPMVFEYMAILAKILSGEAFDPISCRSVAYFYG